MFEQQVKQQQQQHMLQQQLLQHTLMQQTGQTENTPQVGSIVMVACSSNKLDVKCKGAMFHLQKC